MEEELKRLVVDFLETIDNPTTKKNYKIALAQYLKTSKVSRIVDLTQQSVIDYISSIENKSTKSARLAALRSFFQKNSKTISLEIKNDRYKNTKNITKEQFDRLLSHIDISTTGGFRDYFLIKCLFVLGNTKKVVGLKFKDILVEELEGLKETYKTLSGGKEENFIFSPKKGDKALSLSAVRKILAKHCSAANLDIKIDQECLKRLRCKLLYEENKDIEEIKIYCGHSNVKATKEFLRSIFLQNNDP